MASSVAPGVDGLHHLLLWPWLGAGGRDVWAALAYQDTQALARALGWQLGMGRPRVDPWPQLTLPPAGPRVPSHPRVLTPGPTGPELLGLPKLDWQSWQRWPLLEYPRCSQPENTNMN